MTPFNNGHILHLEETFLSGYIRNALMALADVRKYAEYLVAHKRTFGSITPASIKWDGSPSLFVGNDGGFFVSSKKFLNKTKKIQYRTPDEIMASKEHDDVKKKLLVVFKEFKDFKIQDGQAFQGDLLAFNGNHSNDPNGNVTIMGNILRYSFKPSDPLHGKILKAKAVIAWHTNYVKRANRWESRRLHDKDVEMFRQHPTVVGLSQKLGSMFARTTEIYDTHHYDILTVGQAIQTRLEYLEGTNVGSFIGEISEYAIRFVNHLIKTNSFSDGNLQFSHLTQFKHWFLKTVESEYKANRIGLSRYNKYKANGFFKPLEESLICIFDVVVMYAKFKRAILSVVNRLCGDSIIVTIQDKDGKVIPFEHEGVVIETQSCGFIKLVDRTKFSFVNFNPATKRAFDLV